MDIRRKFVKGKLFSTDPQLLRDVGDMIRNEFTGRAAVSQVQAAREGDFFIYVTVYKEAA
jgi:hypothetical protein